MEAATAGASPEARAIAAGAQPAWEATYEHPEYGDLTFRMLRMPRVKDWLAHGQATEEIAAGVTGANAVLAAACAGMRTFIEVPVVDEEREQDPEVPGHERIRKLYYDPLEDEHLDFPVQVWLDWFNWRLRVLGEGREEVKNSSGVTNGEADSDASPATTESHPPTDA